MITFNSSSQRLLLKEASLAAMNLGTGLTNLRKFDFTKDGYFYQASFSLSIGLERLLKLILIYEYYTENMSFPPDIRYLKNKGHNLKALFESVKYLFTKYSIESQLHKVVNEPICLAILDNLSDFAIQNRYFNLNKLSNAASSLKDPLKRWDEEIHKPIVTRHYKPDDIYESKMKGIAKIVALYEI